MSLKMNNRIGISFSLRQAALNALFIIVSSTSLFIVAYVLIENIVEEREHDIINVRIQEYRAWFNEGGVRALKARFDDQLNYSKDVYLVRILSRYNTVLFLNIPSRSESFDSEFLNDIDPRQINTWHSIEGKDKKSVWIVVSISLQPGIILQVGKRSTQGYELLSNFRSVFLRFAIPILIVCAVIGGFLTYNAIKPIRRIIMAVRKIIETGQLNERVPERKERGELDELVNLFNRMLDRNESLIQAMEDSLDNVAHDLKTPMTRLRGIAEQALRNPDDHHACLEALSDCLEESERVVSMLNTLMDVSEAEAGTMKLNLENVSLSDIIKSVVDLYEIIAEENQIKVELKIQENLSIKADPIRIRQVVSNLLDNALKYSQPQTTVTIGLSKIDDSAVVSVSDQGIGISPVEIDRIWDRLYRGDQSRSKKGVGLGLSFVKAIVS
ncbi:HAMP domain-containing histidine kinase, partial [bacterium]|nr:HAMP domain-containing histidine kinase [bacterium]